ncbi:MAG: hypothetical protein GX657_06035 [Chloroflexi bacterium]|nr:hypothetical protein [Chloroflexota bacterium]
MREDFLRMLQDPPKHYRPIPFWSWNERLDVSETRRQIAEMDAAGLGGYFMHARGGLQTPYMGEEWFANISAGIEEARQRGMDAWAYDENGWPSGFADGRVNGRGERYQQKHLRREVVCAEAAPEDADGRTLAHHRSPDGRLWRYYYDVNPYYVDVMDPEVTRLFLEEIYAPYAARYADALGGPLPGFFTDEPQMARSGIPWSLVLPGRYRQTYGEELLDVLPLLFEPLPGYQRARYRFWHLTQELVVTGYMKQLYDWCEAHGALLTGHMVFEERLATQASASGAVMPHYEFLHMPGMDWLTRHIEPANTPLQVASVAHQLGKPRILSESFAGCGWNVTFEELKWMLEWQMVRGVTTLCQHLQGYSLRGIRKRDWPPSLFIQQPWWPDYRALNDAVSRVGMLLAEGRVAFDVLMLHPQSSAWLCYDADASEGMAALNDDFLAVTAALEGAHVPLHYGDERILRRYGRAEGARLRVGEQAYSVVVVPPCDTLASSTVALLDAFVAGGGTLLWVGRQPSLLEGEPSGELARLLGRGRRVADAAALPTALPPGARPISVAGADGREIADIAATWRTLPASLAGSDLRFYFLANQSVEAGYQASVRLPGAAAARLSIEDGALGRLPARRDGDKITFTYELPQGGSLALLVSDSAEAFADLLTSPAATERVPLAPEDLGGEWRLELLDPNALTLDHCAFWFDGALQAEREHVSVIQPRALELERPVEIRMEYRVEVAPGFTPGQGTCLVLERPECFRLEVNGQPVPLAEAGYYRDTSFRKVPIDGLLRPGSNRLTLTTTFRQPPEVYEALRRARVFEAEKNKLTFDAEIEAVYLIGPFAVHTPGTWEPLPRGAARYEGPFVIAPLPEVVALGDLTPQGLPFYSGSVRLSRTLTLGAEEAAGRCLTLSDKMANSVALTVNGQWAGQWFWRPYWADLEGLLRAGENTLTLEITGSLRNLLGPHHLLEGESWTTYPSTFYKEENVWGWRPWTDAYTFVAFGLRP